MTFDPLAAAADLPASWTDNTKKAKALAIASDAIREAAGVPISRATATIELDGDHETLLRLPGPIVSVDAVAIDGTAVTDWRKRAEGLWRRHGWTDHRCLHDEGSTVTITYTFGLSEVPADIADLCIQLAVAWLQHDAEGGGSMAGLQSVRLDDAQETYTPEAAGQVSPVFIPETTRQWLRARFNTLSGAAVVKSSR